MAKKPNATHCELCQRQTRLTFHHLIPRKMHRRKRFAKHYNREELSQGIWICQPCHKGLHKLYDEQTLASEFNSLTALQQDDAIQRHVRWVARQRVRSE